MVNKKDPNYIERRLREYCKFGSEYLPLEVNRIVRYMQMGAICFLVEHILLFIHDSINVEFIRFKLPGLFGFLDLFIYIGFLLFTSFLFIFVTIGFIGMGIELLEFLFFLGIDSAPLFLFFGVTNLYLAFGLINRKKWAFRSLLALECLNLIFNISVYPFQLFQDLPQIIRSILALTVIYFLWKNRFLFNKN